MENEKGRMEKDTDSQRRRKDREENALLTVEAL